MILTVAATAAIVAAAVEAHAQTQREAGSEDRGSRVSVEKTFELPGERGDGKEFALSFVNFVGYDTNPLSERHGSRPSWHVTPDVALRWRNQVASLLRVEATADANTVRYFDNPTADEHELWGRLDVSLTDGAPDGWVPYVQAKGTAHFDPSSDVTASRFYDLVVGVRRSVPLATVGRLRLDVNGGRRQVDPSRRDASMVYGRVEISHPIGEAFELAAVSKARYRMFDAGSYTVRWTSVVALAWAPSWLADSGGILDVSFSVEREFSGLPGGGYLEIDAGPSASFRWTF